ncbi:MAG: hypothetical protein AAF203_09770, partial [Pseudomonadota bacterium]
GDWRFQMPLYKKHFQINTGDSEKLWILWLLFHCGDSAEKLAQAGLDWKLPKKWIQKAVYTQQSLPQLKNLGRIPPEDAAIYLAKPNSRFAIEVFQQLYGDQIDSKWQACFKEAQAFFVDGELPSPLVTGDDLIQYGFSPGPEIARQLKELYKVQIRSKVSNKEDLINRLGKQK